MNKETIEISREKHIKGYSKFSYLNEDSNEILDKLIEWSRGNKFKIYKHKVRHEQENIGKSGEMYKFRADNCRPINIPYCDLVCYLDIYYQ